ncbi:MAG TPA: DinB family protein, partial [Gemmataceae bacterium]
MVDESLDLLTATRGRTLDLVRTLSQAEADARPVPGRWSVGEVLDHLLLAERFFRGEVRQLAALARAGREPVLHRRFADLDISLGPVPRAALPLFTLPLRLVNPFVPRFVRDFLLTSRLVPARHPTAATPRPGRPVQALRRELAESLRETLAVFRDNADLDFRRMWHGHPVLGTNDVPALVRIVALHEQRHQAAIA